MATDATFDTSGNANGDGPSLATFIDHTLLRPEATLGEVRVLCREARDNGFCSVCVNPSYVADCADALTGSGVKVCTVVGFPLGATSSISKAAETSAAVAEGAGEIDMVIHVGALREGRDDYVREDIRAVVKAAQGALVKVIIETALLDDEQKVRACRLAEEAGADFVKTSTGFAGGGATTADIEMMRSTVGDRLGVKASGGIRTRSDADAMVAAGATRIGASASVAIVSAPSTKSGDA